MWGTLRLHNMRVDMEACWDSNALGCYPTMCFAWSLPWICTSQSGYSGCGVACATITGTEENWWMAVRCCVVPALWSFLHPPKNNPQLPKQNYQMNLRVQGNTVRSHWDGDPRCCTVSPSPGQNPSEIYRYLQCSQRWSSAVHHWTYPFSSGTASSSPVRSGTEQSIK